MKVTEVKLSERAKKILAVVVEITMKTSATHDKMFTAHGGYWHPRSRETYTIRLSGEDIKFTPTSDGGFIKMLAMIRFIRLRSKSDRYVCYATRMGHLYYERVLRDREDWVSRRSATVPR